MIYISVGLSLIFRPYICSLICDLLKDIFINSDYVSYTGFRHPCRQVAQATKFCTVAPIIYESSLWNFIHVALMVQRILRRFLDFLKILSPVIIK